MDFEEVEYVKVKAELFWASTLKHDSLADGRFSIKVGRLSDAAKAKLEELGIKVNGPENKYFEERGNWVGVYSTQGFRVEGVPEHAQGTEPGNGTEAEVVLFPYHYKHKGKKGISAKVRNIKVTNWVDYTPGSGGDDGEELDTL